MIVNILLLSIALVALIVGTITDIKFREVPDWINFGLIFAGIGIRLIYSSITFDWMFLAYGIFGLIVAVVLSYIMFYAGQWGGGDAKLLMGLGALIGLPFSLQQMPLFLVFLINILLVGAIYGLVYSITLAFINRKKFLKIFKKIMYDKKVKIANLLAFLASAFFILIITILIDEIKVRVFLIIAIVFLYLSLYLIVFVKAVELSAMFKLVNPSELTEGDWIAKDVFVDKKKICGPKDLGINKKQIKQLVNFSKKNKVKKIKIKEGIPFVPSFLIAFILSLSLGAWWMILF